MSKREETDKQNIKGRDIQTERVRGIHKENKGEREKDTERQIEDRE